MKNTYKIGFDVKGFILFLAVMTPNLIWFVIPAPNDILRKESVTALLDTAASVCQTVMIVALCICINKNRGKIRRTPFIIFVILCCLLYFIAWIFYYNGITNALIILFLCIMPCLAFLLYAIYRKNIVAAVSAFAFMIGHLASTIINFIV